MQRPSVRHVLDLGCGDGEYLLRFRFLAPRQVGLDLSFSRLRPARQQQQPVVQADGLQLPFPNAAFDLIYVAHVLHHVADFPQMLREISRCLTSDGKLFVVETVTDSPLLRLARRIRPYWQGDRAETHWRFAELQQVLRQAGFVGEQHGRYNLIFFLWEMIPLACWPLEVLTPLFVYLDILLARLWRRYTAHCYFVLKHES